MLAVAIAGAADANEKRRRAAIKPRSGFKHADDAADRPVGRGFTLIGVIPTDQPIAERRGLESVDLVTIADRNAGMEPVVGRAKQSCASGQSQEDLNRPLFLGSCPLGCGLDDPLEQVTLASDRKSVV